MKASVIKECPFYLTNWAILDWMTTLLGMITRDGYSDSVKLGL